MNLTFSYPGAEHSVRCILEFTADGQSPFWRDPVFHFFPQLDRETYLSLPPAQRKSYLMDFFSAFETENRALIVEKVQAYNAHWQTCRAQATRALEDGFQTKLENRFNDMRGLLTFCPVCPRYLEDSSFDVFYLNSERGALGIALHEIIHFVWFSEWSRLFQDDPSQYETPHLPWIFSEMAVDTVMRDERLTALNPYQQNGGTAYPYFYTLQIDSSPILDTLYELYRAMPIERFMTEGYRYCQAHEPEIRQHIAASENT